MSREAQAFVMVLLGGTLVHTAATDLYLRYVKSGLRPLVLVAGVVLIVAAVVTVWYEWRPKKQAAAHAHREPGVSWLLLLPVLGLTLVAPPALGSYSATNAGTALQNPSAFAALPSAGPLQLGVVDYAGRAVFDHGRSLADRPITLTGFVSVDHDGRPYLTRMTLSCCAADAAPVKVGLTGQVPPVLAPDSWLAVTGTYTARQTADPVNGRPVPYLDISRAEPVAAPVDPYER